VKTALCRRTFLGSSRACRELVDAKVDGLLAIATKANVAAKRYSQPFLVSSDRRMRSPRRRQSLARPAAISVRDLVSPSEMLPKRLAVSASSLPSASRLVVFTINPSTSEPARGVARCRLAGKAWSRRQAIQFLHGRRHRARLFRPLRPIAPMASSVLRRSSGARSTRSSWLSFFAPRRLPVLHSVSFGVHAGGSNIAYVLTPEMVVMANQLCC